MSEDWWNGIFILPDDTGKCLRPDFCHKNASKLAEEAGDTLHGFCEMVRREQSKHVNKIVHRSPRRRLRPTGVRDNLDSSGILSSLSRMPLTINILA